MNSKMFFIAFIVLSCSLVISAGVAYDDQSVCKCLGPDFKTHRCLCREQHGYAQSDHYNSQVYVDPHSNFGRHQQGEPQRSAPLRGHPYGNDMILHRNPQRNYHHHHNHHY